MVIVNGTLMIVEQTGGTYVNGVPQSASHTLSEPIPCNISGNRRRDNKNDETSYTSATYEVLIDSPCDFYADEVILNNNRNSRIGIFRVQDIQYLDSVDAVKIICERYAD